MDAHSHSQDIRSGERPGSVFEAIGGMETFETLVDGFYAQVPDDDILAPMYPEQDFAGARDRLLWFLVQFWGGPKLFNERRGAPRLRMRHAEFPIDTAAAERWLELMGRSLDKIDEKTIPAEYRTAIWNHMQKLAYMLRNMPDESVTASGQTGHAGQHPGHPGNTGQQTPQKPDVGILRRDLGLR